LILLQRTASLSLPAPHDLLQSGPAPRKGSRFHRRDENTVAVAAQQELLEQRTLLSGMNNSPTLDAISDFSIYEGSGQQLVQLSGITAGAGESQTLRVTAVSNNTALIPNPVVTYTSPDTTGSIEFAPMEGQTGTATITVTVEDAGPDGDLNLTSDNAVFSRSFNVTTVDPATTMLADLVIGPQSDVILAGLTVAPNPDGRMAPVQVDLSEGTGRWIEFSSVTGIVNAGPNWPDNGPDGGTLGPNGETGTNVHTANGVSGIYAPRFLFLAGVFLTDDTPSAETRPERLVYGSASIDAPQSNPLIQQSFYIGDGQQSTGAIQRFNVPDGATRFYLGFIDSVGFGWPDGGFPGAYQDNTGSFTASLTVTVPNLPPTLDAVADVTVEQDVPQQSVSLTGVTSGAGSMQPLRVTASSSNSALIPDPLVNYTSADTGGSLNFTPATGQNGTATITVTVEDGGLDGDLNTPGDNATVSQQFDIVVRPAPPVITTPDNLKTADSLFMLDWDPVGGAEGYEVWYTYATTGESPVIQQTVTTNSFVPSSPLPIGRYFIWVRVKQDDGTASPWSESIRVQVASPVENASVEFPESNSTPTFSWDALPGAARYEIWVNNVTTGTTQVISETNLTSTSFTPASGLSLGLHRVWVRGFDAAGVPSAWSVPQDFSPGPHPLAPLTPLFDARPTFEWSAVPGAATYDLYLSTSGGVIQQTGLTGTSWTPPSDLPTGVVRWWVRGRTSGDTPGPWSARVDIDTQGRPFLQTPSGTTTDASPQFTWSAVAAASRYDLYVSRLDVPGLAFRETSLTSNTFIPSLMEDGNYRVWVRAFDATDAAGPWSRPVDFTVDAATGTLTTSPVSPYVSTFDTTPAFQWSDATGAASYDFYLTDGVSIVEEYGLTTPAFTPAASLYVANWTWWVRAVDAVGDAGPWSSPASLHVGGRTIVSGPSAMTADTTPVFEWGEVEGAGRYVLHVETLAGTVVIREDNVTATSFTAMSALAQGDYRVWVKAISAADDVSGFWSAARGFSIVNSVPENDMGQGLDGNLFGDRGSVQVALLQSKPQQSANERRADAGDVGVADSMTREAADRVDRQPVGGTEDSISAQPVIASHIASNNATDHSVMDLKLVDQLMQQSARLLDRLI
jgi:hypothetical protein